jgi:PAS domain S-box-containing protein
MSQLYHQGVLTDEQELSDFLENILQASTQYSIIALATDGTIQLWNEGARLLYGYEPGEVIGIANMSLLHTPSDVAAGRPEQMKETALADGRWAGTVERARKTGVRFLASVMLTVRAPRGLSADLP